MLQLLIVLQVVWRSGATTIDCVAGCVALRCYTCENERSNSMCINEDNLYPCSGGMDTCQTIVSFSGRHFVCRENVLKSLQNCRLFVKHEPCLICSVNTRACDIKKNFNNRHIHVI